MRTLLFASLRILAALVLLRVGYSFARSELVTFKLLSRFIQHRLEKNTIIDTRDRDHNEQRRIRTRHKSKKKVWLLLIVTKG